MLITDEYIINLLYTNKGRFIKSRLSKCSDVIIKYLQNRYTDSLSIEETVIRIYHNIDIHPKCPYCGNLVAITNKYKFKYTCSNKQCIKKYHDSINPFNNPEVQKNIHSKLNNKSDIDKQKTINKRKQTCLEKYGGNSPFCSSDIIKKSKQTCLTKYGVTNGGGSEEAIEKIKQTKLERYGDENYRNEEKIKQTNLNKYGVEYGFSSNIIKEKIKQTCLEKYGITNGGGSEEAIEKIKQTKLERYGDENYRNEKKIKQTCLEKYGSKSYFGSIDFFKHINNIQNKRINTLRKHNTWNISSIEQQLKQYFDDNDINYKYQYKSELYPYCCDFYFPDNDLYVEIQGNWTHGNKPYENTIEDNIILNKWKQSDKLYYKNAINTWTIYDVRKREIAKQNNLNYLEIFSIDFDTCINLINKQCNNE